MARLSSVNRAASVPTAADPNGSGWVGALGFGAAVTAALLSAFLAHVLLNDFRLPIGPDGPVYAWRAGYAAEAGITEAPGGRPGILAILLTLGGVFSLEPVEAVTLLGPVVAVSVGLAGAAVLETSLGPSLLRAGTGAVLTGAFAAYLAGGWLSNIVLTAAFLGALAALALAELSWRPVIAAGALLGAATLTHPMFATVAFSIVAVLILTLARDALARVRHGRRLRETASFRVCAAAVGGASVGLMGLVPTLGAVTVPGDTSQDGFFRRYGFIDLLRDRYRERFAGDLGRAAVPIATGAALAMGGWWARGPSSTGRRYLLRVLLAWAAVAVIGLVALGLTGWGPPYRLLAFSFFVPLAAAWGLHELVTRRHGLAALGALAAIAFAVASMWGWYRQSPNIGEDDLIDVRRAGRAVAAIPSETPVVVLVESDQPAAAFHVTRMANLVRMGLPADRLPETRIAVGSPSDFRAGRPTLYGDREHDLVARAYLREAESVRTDAAIVVLERFNPQGFPEATRLGEEVLPGVAVIGAGRIELLAEESATERAGLGGTELVILSLATVALLVLVGAGWARWALPGLGARSVISLAPAAGLAVMVLAGLLADLVGATPGEVLSLAVVAIGGGAGYLVARR